MDAFWSFWVILTLLVILGPNLLVFGQQRKKVNFSTRRRHISAAYRLILKNMFFDILDLFAQTSQKVFFLTRRRHISAAYLTS